MTIIDPVTSAYREDFGETYFELRKHKGVSRQMALDAMTDVSTFGTMMVHRGIADGMVSGAVHTTQQTIRPALEVSGRAGLPHRVERLLHVPSRPRPGLRRLRHQSGPHCRATGAHRHQLRGNRPKLRYRTRRCHALLLDGRIRERCGSRQGEGSHPHRPAAPPGPQAGRPHPV